MKDNQNGEKTVIVTGGASRIGRGIALKFAEKGANVVIADIQRSPKETGPYEGSEVEPTDVKINEELSGTAIYTEANIRYLDNVKQIISDTIDEFGSVDILVNNAGINIFTEDEGPLAPYGTEELSPEQWKKIVEVNLYGMFYCSKLALPYIKENSGHIINISSVHGSEGGWGPGYTSTKAGIENYTRDLATEVGPDGVNVNAVAPGVILVPPHDIPEDELGQQRHLTVNPHFGTPNDIAEVVEFLVSDKASFIQGEVIHVDGGWSAHRI